jgi:hypothetical protein
MEGNMGEHKKGVCAMTAPEKPPATVTAEDGQELTVLDRRAILAQPAMTGFVTVTVPEWGPKAAVCLREMSGAERDAFEASVAALKSEGQALVNFRARLLAATICDAERRLIFEPGDIAELGKKSARAIGRLFDVAARLSGITGKDVEEAEGN